MMLELQAEIVQGPIDHPRLGKTLLVKPTIAFGRAGRVPSQAIVVTTVARRVLEIVRLGERIQAMIIEGEKDPTTHPDFHEISENLRDLLSKHFPKAKFCLVSEAPVLTRAETRHAMTLYDQTFVQLDAGTQKTYAALTGGEPRAFKEIIENLGRLDSGRFVVQTRFVRGEVDNSNETEVRAWIKLLNEIKPSAVHITTSGKAGGKKERPVPKTRIAEIAELVAEKTGLPVEVAAG